jgi:hypothetical protein
MLNHITALLGIAHVSQASRLLVLWRHRQQATDIAGNSVSGTWPGLAGKDWMTSGRAVEEPGTGHQSKGLYF